MKNITGRKLAKLKNNVILKHQNAVIKYKGSFLFLFFLSVVASGQNVVTGKVYDAQTRQPLAFVNIITNSSNIGTATDIDGEFQITSQNPIRFLSLTYVGYQPKYFYVKEETRGLKIYLEKTSVELSEVVVVAGENPAHRIIKNVVANRKRNNPEKMSSFSYTSYEKLVFTIDTLEINEEGTDPTDSSYINLKQFLNDKDFFILENVTERKFLAPDRNHEKIIASRVSGFRDPILVFLSTQLQSSTFYNELIRIADKNYINPISKGSTLKYSFRLEDTTYTARGDSVFVISYRPRINTNFDGLKGVLYINSFGWAIQNVIAEPSREEDGLAIKIQQMYALVDDTTWFPVQLNTDIIFNNVKVNNFIPVGKGKHYIHDIVLNPDLVRRQFNQVSIEFDPNANNRSEAFWLSYRGDSLTKREQRTYQFIDSVGQEANLDKKAYTVKSLLRNRLPVGKIDVDLAKIGRYNNYEGLYLGLGLRTNRKLSQSFEAGGYWGYGFKDKRAKYGGDVAVTIDRYREIKMRLAYFDDVTETGGVKFYGDNDNVLNPDNFRNFLIKNMDQTERMHGSLSFRALRYGLFHASLTRDRKRVTNDYYFDAASADPPDEKPEYIFTEFSAGIRYAYKEEFLVMPDSRISLGTNYPIVWFQYTRGLQGTLDGEFAYNKFDLRILKKFYLKYLGESNFELLAGFIDTPVPHTNLYNGRGSYRAFTIYAPASFATQRMNEFLSSRYVYLFYTHNFGHLLWRGKKFSPEFAIAANLGFGDLDHPEYHKGVEFKTMEKGYFESGLLINNLLNMSGIYTIGVGAFYRYGAYHLPNTADNIAYKVTLVFPF